MELAPQRPNVELRLAQTGEPVVVFAFPYDAEIVQAMRMIPGRRFDWVEKEWSIPQHDATAVYVADILARWPQLVAEDAVHTWLAGAPSGWLGRVTAQKRGGRGEFAIRVIAGTLPDEILALAGETAERGAVLPFSQAAADLLLEEPGARLDRGAANSASRLQVGIDPPRAALTIDHTVAEARLGIEVLWDHDAVAAFKKLPGVETRSATLPIDPWVVEPLEAYLRTHEVDVAPPARPVLAQLRAEHDEAVEHIRRSRAKEAEPLDLPLGGELAPFQWAGVRYVLDARRTFLADEQGLGKTVQALAALEADDAWPAVVVCPANLKLVWEREAAKWLPHRSRTLVSGRGTHARGADLTILNYEIVASHSERLLRERPKALVLDESHYCKNPRAKRTVALRKLAQAMPSDALRVALSGTPVMNRPEEIVAQLRILGRLDEFGSGSQLKRRFSGMGAEERLHWHLRRRCFVRRLKKDVLPQLPDKRQVVVPMGLDNLEEYQLAERDVIAWLREQPLDLGELDAKIAAALRAERLAQLNTLKRLAARGKLSAAVSWIHDFLEHDEPLVVFSHHEEVQSALLRRFPDAGHLLGSDSAVKRNETVERYQDGSGHPLLICSTLVAGQGITLTRASNVAFVELEWTPALHDQAEDRCHRIGQHDAVTAWYLLAAGTIDERIAELLQAKRAVVGAVTDGRRVEDEGLISEVVRALRGGEPLRRHLRPVA